MEDYEKKYKEALNWMKDVYLTLEGATKEDAEHYFPELKESECEKMVNFITNELACIRATDEKGSCRYEELTNAIHWIEKQCEHKSFDYEDAHIQQNEFAPKIEPKFSVGDWIVQENIGVYKVIEICESWYEVINSEDEHYSISFDKEHMCHFWNISDAKDGDVLYENYSNTVLIFKSQTYGRVKVYCDFWTNKNKFTGTDSTDYGRVSEMDLKPATKKQRELLFQKIHEAGYEWNPEKKELKKIEQNFTWDEEDETKIKSIIAFLKSPALCAMEDNKGIIDENIKYLKSFRYKVQPKQEWSEEDEEIGKELTDI